jgi:biotin transport system substrate-specific component
MKRSIAWHLTEKEFLAEPAARRTVGIITFLCLITLGAFVYIPFPFTPVPFTLQTFFVLLCGAFLTKKDGVFVQALYAGMGAIGLPVFSAAQGGILKLFGPTGGYIVGFAMAIFILKSMLEWFKNKNLDLSFAQVLGSMSLAAAAIFLFGGLWLGFTMQLGFQQVFILGVLPFIPGAVIKVLLASIIYYKANNRIKSLFV